MDFTDLIPLIIIALVFLFGKSSKKKAEEAKKKAEGIGSSTTITMATGEAPATTPVSLQERLEQALREMQQRVEAESAGVTESVSPTTTPAATVTAPSRRSDLDEGNEFASEQSVPFDALTIERPVTSEQADAPFAFHSLRGADESVARNYHESGFKEYSSAHGLHFGETHSPEAVRRAEATEFHEAHGLNYGRERAHPMYASATDKEAEEERAKVRIFQGPDDIRRAIILSEILGRPKAMKRGVRGS